MGLRTKFNLVLLVVFTLGLTVTGYISYTLLQQNARDEVLRNAGIIMEATQSMRDYTQKHVSPHLDYQPDTFLPQTVPAFAATEMMNGLRKKYSDYNYKEAVLNPTNPRDRAVDWEADIVNAFRGDAVRADISGTRKLIVRLCLPDPEVSRLGIFSSMTCLSRLSVAAEHNRSSA